MDNINWELSISIFSLVLSICSIFYAYFNKKSDIDLVEAEIDRESSNLYIIFTVINPSEISVKLEDVILMKNDKIVKDNGYEPSIPYLTNAFNVRFSEPFQENVYIQPNSEVSFSYYLNDDEIPNRIVVKTNKRISYFRKSKSFPVVFKSY